MTKFKKKLPLGVSLIPLFIMMGAGAANAQNAPETKEENVVIVTGSSLRGVAPVGSNLTSVTRVQLEQTGAQTVQQVLKTVPAIVGLNSPGQGGFGSFDGAGTNAPTIHGLGASASNSTLVLINGHRIPLTGVNHTLADPNIISPLGLERVEVLADGASSVYGSDAVAGVVNFITRRKFEGFETNTQAGFGDSYNTFNFALVGGEKWDTGAFLLAANYSKRSNLNAGKRDYTNGNHVAQGGTNLSTFACSTATVVTGGLVYFAPYTSGGVANNAVLNGNCSYPSTWDLIPEETRYGAMASIEQELGANLKFSADLIYSNRKNIQNISRGSVTGITAFGANMTTTNAAGITAGTNSASQINPFFVAPTGSSTIGSETISMDFNELLGPGATITGSAETTYFAPSFEYKLTDAWTANFGGVFGRDNSATVNNGTVCGSCVNLALNGTTQASGNMLTPAVPNTTIRPTQALTAANALDVWRTGSANLTSAATRKFITDNRQMQQASQTLVNLYAKIDGEAFNLAGGPAKIAAGVEASNYTMAQDTLAPLNTGPVSLGSRFTHLDYERQVKSAFLEVFLPLIGEDQNIPFMQRFDVNISGRVDDYSDFGQTSNPKVAFNWQIIDGLKFRGNWAESFVAPALTSIGIADGSGTTGESSITGGPTITLSTSLFPSLIGLPNCPTGSTTCAIGSGPVTGLQINGGSGSLKPQTGEAMSLGIDYRPSYIPGFSLSVTYWENKLRNGITAPATAISGNSGALASRFHIYTAGATPSQIAAEIGSLPVNVSLPATVYYFYDNRQGNVLNLDVAGWDIEGHYRLNTDVGRFTADGSLSYKTKFDQFFGASGAKFSVLGTANFNLTFPSIEKEGRLTLGYSKGDFSSSMSFNYTGSYLNWGGVLKNPLVRNSAQLPVSGGDVVDSNTTIDLNLSYKFHNLGPLDQATFYVDITNLADSDPPFMNSYGVNGASGYDGANASPIGRVFSVGVRTKF